MISAPRIPDLSSSLLRDPKELAAHLQQRRAAEGAEELEASLFSQVLEKMEKSLSITGEESSDAGHESWAAIGVHALAQGLAHRHLLGVAGMVERALGIGAATPAAGAPAESGAAKENPPGELNPLKSVPRMPIENQGGIETQ